MTLQVRDRDKVMEPYTPKLPVIWQPDGAYSLTEVADNLRGVTPQSPTLSITPENWYFVH